MMWHVEKYNQVGMMYIQFCSLHVNRLLNQVCWEPTIRRQFAAASHCGYKCHPSLTKVKLSVMYTFLSYPMSNFLIIFTLVYTKYGLKLTVTFCKVDPTFKTILLNAFGGVINLCCYCVRNWSVLKKEISRVNNIFTVMSCGYMTLAYNC